MPAKRITQYDVDCMKSVMEIITESDVCEIQVTLRPSQPLFVELCLDLAAQDKLEQLLWSDRQLANGI